MTKGMEHDGKSRHCDTSPMAEHENNSRNSFQGHSKLCSAVAGISRGVGNGLLQSTTGVDVVKKTVDRAMKGGVKQLTGVASYSTLRKQFTGIFTDSKSPRVALRMLIPGFFSFETHHQVAHHLFEEVNGRNSSGDTYLRKIRSHLNHFVAGAAGGLTYGLVASGLDQKFSLRSMNSHILGHGALFGGYDCFFDIFNALFNNGGFELSTHSKPNTWQKPISVSLAGGFAGICQVWMKGVIALSKNSPMHSAAEQSLRDLMRSPRFVIQAFLPGATAFSSYEYVRYIFATKRNHQ